MKFVFFLAAIQFTIGSTTHAMVNCNADEWNKANQDCVKLGRPGACECQNNNGTLNIVCDEKSGSTTIIISDGGFSTDPAQMTIQVTNFLYGDQSQVTTNTTPSSSSSSTSQSSTY